MLQDLKLQSGHVLPIRGRDIVIQRDGRALLDGATLTVSAGARLTVLLGPNGAGKSLLIRALAGLVSVDAGAVTWAGATPDRERARRVGFVLQRPVMLARSALDNLVFALRAAGHEAASAHAFAKERLTQHGLAHISSTAARKLSGGEQQRLSLLRALVLDPEVLFLDEPTANLDPSSTLAIERQLKAAAEGGAHVVLVTQDMGQARRLANDVVFVHKGQVHEQADASEFFRAPTTPQARAFISGELVF